MTWTTRMIDALSHQYYALDILLANCLIATFNHTRRQQHRLWDVCAYLAARRERTK